MLIKGKDVKNITIPAAITIKGASYKVTAVGDQAFANKGKIQKLTIGINVTKIGKKAFMKCKKLKNVIFKGAKPHDTAGRRSFLYLPTRLACSGPPVRLPVHP